MGIKNKEAVSPVIGVILMVAITVILAAVIYVWVSGFIGGGAKQAPVMGATCSGSSGTYTYRVTIQQSTPSISVKGVNYYIMTGDDVVVADGIVADIYSKNVGGIKFHDNNVDGRISVNDMFLIESSFAGYTLVLKSTTPDAIILDTPIL